VGLFPANAVGDDIEVYDDEDRSAARAKLFSLRQQVDKDSDDPYLALADFVAPKDSGIADYVGLFCCSAGFGLEKIIEDAKANNDDFRVIMAEALADRLAEALAEKLHEEVRKDHWGYAPEENFQPEELLKCMYQGIRPAPGYPSQADGQERATLFDLLSAKEATGVELTENLAMLPAASVCGLYFASPESSYFAHGKLARDQVADYAARTGKSLAHTEKWLGPSLGYEPKA